MPKSRAFEVQMPVEKLLTIETFAQNWRILYHDPKWNAILEWNIFIHDCLWWLRNCILYSNT